MNTVNISLCAGKSERFEGKPKHCLKVDGETLIDRQRRQFDGIRIIDNSEVGSTIATCETLMLSSHLWIRPRTIVLLGDVYYTDSVVKRIKQCLLPIVFWSDEQDIFAIKFHVSEACRIIAGCQHVLSGKIRNNGRLWELYRYFVGFPWNAHLPDDERRFLQLVSDKTQDFDTPQEYDDFINGKMKNKLYHP